MLKLRDERYFELTSDDFFRRKSRLLSRYKIDVAFIDGLHDYKQSLRDVLNTLNCLETFGVIVMHDCNPPSEIIATPLSMYVPKSKPWTGDVWKTIVHLRSLREDLNVFVLDCDWGIGIITRGKPENMLDYFITDIEQMSYRDLSVQRKSFLNLKEPDYLYEFLENF